VIGRAPPRPGTGVLLLALAALASLFAQGCGTVEPWTDPAFERSDKATLKRVGIYTAALPPGTPAAIAPLAERIARRYVHQHRDFLIVSTGKRAPAGVDGVIVLDLKRLAREGGDVDVELVARLVRARRPGEAWRCVAARRVPSDHEDLKNLVERYGKELGPEAAPYAAPLFVVLKSAFDTMPTPALDDEDVLAKIELED